MAYSFDTLGYAKRLREAGVDAEQAEAHAEAARDFVMAELVTKQDLELTRHSLEGDIRNMELRVNNRIDGVERTLGARIDSVEQGLGSRIDNVEQGLGNRIDGGDQRLSNRIDSLEMRLMIRIGGMLAVAVAILAAIIKL